MKKLTSLLLAAVILVSGCSANPTRTARSTFTETPTPQPPTPTNTPIPVSSSTATEEPEEPTVTPTAALPMVTLIQDTVCRMGPGENYNKVITEPKNKTVAINGRNEDTTWVIITEESLSCWIPVSAIKKPGDLGELRVSRYKALPVGPSWIAFPEGGCSAASQPVFLQWGPVSNRTQYRIFRNGRAIFTMTGGDQFYDADIPSINKAFVYTYAVQAFNDYGVSTTVSITVSICAKK